MGVSRPDVRVPAGSDPPDGPCRAGRDSLRCGQMKLTAGTAGLIAASVVRTSVGPLARASLRPHAALGSPPSPCPAQRVLRLDRAFGAQADESFYWGNAILGLVAIAPALYAVCRAPSFGFASLLGVVFGGVSTALANFWLMFFQGYSVWTMGGTVLGYIGYNALLFPFLRGFGRLETRLRPFLLAAAWAALRVLQVRRLPRLPLGPGRISRWATSSR